MSDKQAAFPVKHQRQYVDFRVVVYRLRIPGNVTVGGRTVAINDILAADFADRFYQEISNELNKSSGNGNSDPVFLPFLDAVYGNIYSALMNGSVPRTPSQLAVPGSDGNAVFQILDITPLVETVDTELDIEQPNRCTITMLDPREADFKQLELSRYQKVAPVANVIDIAKLRGFVFSEFDLVRVFVSTDFDKRAADRIADLETKMTKLGYPSGSGKTFFMRPAFTGLVVDIAEHNAVGNVAMITANCLGIKRAFTQSVTTYSDATASVVTAATPELGVLDDKFTTFLNSFTDMKANDMVKKIFDEYFITSFLSASPGDDPAIAVPSISNIVARMKTSKNFGGIQINSNLIPMLPTVILLHLLKLQYRETILQFDDRLKGPLETVTGSLSADVAPAPINGSAPAVDLDKQLEPYLFRVRDTFANFDTSYISAEEVFQVLRDTTYMEMFEDRTGTFHFRFPRYNQAEVRHEIGLDQTMSSDFKRDDSAVYSCNVTQRMMPGGGGPDLIDGRVFVDKISILRYGFRRPQTIENPNTTNELFAQALSKFVRDYRAGREARTAMIDKLGDPTIDVGQMVLFHHGRPARANPAVGRKDSTIFRTYAGYVVNISESLSVSGTYTQTLRLAFVREASIHDTSGFVGPVSPVAVHGTPWDAAELATLTSSDNWKTKSTLDTETTGTTVEDYLSLLNAGRSSYIPSAYRYVSSSLDLAKESAKKDNINGAAANKALLYKNGKPTGSAKDFDAALNAVIAQIKERVNVLGDWLEKARLLDAMSGILIQTQNLYGVGDSTSKASYLNAGASLSPALARENTKSNAITSVPVTVEHQKVTSVVINGVNVPFVPTFAGGSRSIPSLSFSLILDQTAANSKAINPTFKRDWNTVFNDPLGGTNSKDSSFLTSDFRALASQMYSTMEETVQVASAALKGIVSTDTKIDELVAYARELEKAKAEAAAAEAASASATRYKVNSNQTNPALAGLTQGDIGTGDTVVSSQTTAVGFQATQ